MRKRADVPKSSVDSGESFSSGTIKKLSDLTPDTRNANRGTKRGSEMIQASLKEYGAGRSILLDKHGNIIAGNKTAENFGALGHEDVLVVQTNGDQLVAVQRMDLDLAEPKALQLALADNRAGEVSLDWDADVLKELAGEIDLAPFWSDLELADIWGKPIDDSWRTLAERFGAPPFSVLDARQGYWQERKKAWLSLGIKSEVGRGGTPSTSERAESPTYRQIKASPGGQIAQRVTTAERKEGMG